MLNRSKGAAVQGPRVQADRRRFARAIQTMVAAQPNVSVIDGEAIALDLAGGRVSGVTLADGAPLRAPMVILATGTFLGGRLFCGEERGEGGRPGDRAATALGLQLRALDRQSPRLKIGRAHV